MCVCVFSGRSTTRDVTLNTCDRSKRERVLAHVCQVIKTAHDSAVDRLRAREHTRIIAFLFTSSHNNSRFSSHVRACDVFIARSRSRQPTNNSYVSCFVGRAACRRACVRSCVAVLRMDLWSFLFVTSAICMRAQSSVLRFVSDGESLREMYRSSVTVENWDNVLYHTKVNGRPY